MIFSECPVNCNSFALYAVTNYTDDPSARTLRRASLIAEDAAAFGIPIAKMPDVLMAKKWGFLRNIFYHCC